MQISVLQGSFDEILLINIFINNLCLPVFLTFLSNYADDNSLFIMVSPKATLIKGFKTKTDWFYGNFIVLNHNTENTDQDSFTFGGLCFMNNKKKEILDANIDSKLSFNNHIQFVEKSVEKLIRKSLLSPGQMNTMTGIKEGRVKSCRLQVFLKKGVLKNFEIFTGKQNNVFYRTSLMVASVTSNGAIGSQFSYPD